MTYKQIEACREIRLWIRDIIIPALGIMALFPEAREWAKNQVLNAKHKIDHRHGEES